MNENEGSDFLYENDFDTVDDSRKAETVYLKVSYHGKLPAQGGQGADFTYADDLDVADDGNFENKESQCEKCEQNSIMKKALCEIDKQTGLMAFLDANEWATSDDYFAHVARQALKQL